MYYVFHKNIIKNTAQPFSTLIYCNMLKTAHYNDFQRKIRHWRLA